MLQKTKMCAWHENLTTEVGPRGLRGDSEGGGGFLGFFLRKFLRKILDFFPSPTQISSLLFFSRFDRSFFGSFWVLSSDLEFSIALAMEGSVHFTEGMRKVINGDSSSSSINLEDFPPLHGESRSWHSPVWRLLWMVILVQGLHLLQRLLMKSWKLCGCCPPWF